MMLHSNGLKSRGVARGLIRGALAALTLGLVGLGSPAVRASMPVQAQVSGAVSAVEGTAAVTINGTTYLIAPDSLASRTIQSVNVGDTVGLVLSGPAGSATSQVVYILTASGAGSSPAGARSDTGTR